MSSMPGTSLEDKGQENLFLLQCLPKPYGWRPWAQSPDGAGHAEPGPKEVHWVREFP